jgi:Eukaryotic and archaeal DNA primase, large subunit
MCALTGCEDKPEVNKIYVYVRHAGCPFRHNDADSLRQKLQSLQVSSDGISEVCILVLSGYSCVNCTHCSQLRIG